MKALTSTVKDYVRHCNIGIPRYHHSYQIFGKVFAARYSNDKKRILIKYTCNSPPSRDLNVRGNMSFTHLASVSDDYTTRSPSVA